MDLPTYPYEKGFQKISVMNVSKKFKKLVPTVA